MNYPLIFGILILISTILQNLLENNFSEIWDPKLSIIGLGIGSFYMAFLGISALS